MGERDEHHLATSYTRAKRLSLLGIDNRHASIEGMHMLSQKDEKMVAQAILAMRKGKPEKASSAAP